jgi:hypothetical protein
MVLAFRAMSGQTFAGPSGTRAVARLLAVLAGLFAVLLPAIPAGAVAPDDESYPPDAIVNLLDPFGCDPSAVTGEIGAVEAGSTVTLQVILVNEVAGIIRQAAPAGDVLGSTSAAADGNGQLEYTIPIETGRYGSVVVFASGTNTIGDPFTLETGGEVVPCPEGQIPRTGSDTGRWLQLGFAAVIVGVILVAATRRRKMRTSS